MSDDETEDADNIDVEDLIENPPEVEREPTLFEELPNLSLSRRLEMWRDSDIEGQQRPRGILSKTDREYLLGLKEYENEQSEANRRQDIRDRIKNSLKDFKIIWALLDEKDRNQIFSSLDDETVDNCIEAMVSFIYLGLDGDIPRIEKAIKRGILAGENATSEGETKQVEVSINIDHYPDVEAAKEKMQRSPLVELTVEELGVLAKANELDPSHIEKLNDDHIYPPPGYFDSTKTEPTVDKDPLNYDLEEAGEDSDINSDGS
ncbi:hypothetical protein [Halobellus clavatus]|uniref:Domain of unknown function domain-containing protein n=1 Tax=Halobellus clavatus TaxID=660517 RepID=A0A1H3J745_9EURY|nr:hypothetical protein [Halobellus clavatus]SDY35803.1 hypothetical protein SAMN04487946_11257 [Halobellus clavatus]